MRKDSPSFNAALAPSEHTLALAHLVVIVSRSQGTLACG